MNGRRSLKTVFYDTVFGTFFIIRLVNEIKIFTFTKQNMYFKILKRLGIY